LHGHRSCSVWYWQRVGRALDLDRDDLDKLLLGNTRRTQGGGTLAGSIRART
jgi:hypothetical protein